jgi:hypothetical protein
LATILPHTIRHFARSAVALSAAYTLVFVTASHAARPLITDDARIADPQACQLKTWMRRNQGSTEY